MKVTGADRTLAACVTATMVVVVVATLYPFVYVIAVSLSRPSAVMAGKVALIPVGFTTEAYRYVLKSPGLAGGFPMSAFYVVSGTATLLLLVSLTAYPLSIKGLHGGKTISFVIIFTMFFSGGMIPTFLWIRTLGMLDTVWAIILPSALSSWYVMIFRTFLRQQPDSLRESAFIDGANDLLILFRIILPLSKPIVATLAVFHMVYHWNSFFPALLYLRDERLLPVQMILRRVLTFGTEMERVLAQGEDYALPQSVQAAFIVIIVFPIVVVYPFAQRYFTKGMMIGALKG